MSHYDFKSTRGNIFLEYLNSVYTSKQYLLSFLPEIQSYVTNSNLNFAIEEFSDDNDLQIVSLDTLYSGMEESFVAKSILGIRIISLDAYKAAIKLTLDPLERDCAILFCLQAIDAVEVIYFKNLCVMADSFEVNRLHLRVPFDYALDNLNLFHNVYEELVS